MLVLTRRRGEQIIIDGKIRIKVLDAGRSTSVRIGIEAPESMQIVREELLSTASRGIPPRTAAERRFESGPAVQPSTN